MDIKGKKEGWGKLGGWDWHIHCCAGASQVAPMVKSLPAMQETERRGFRLWVGTVPWRRAWQPTPVFLPGESHGQRSLAGYSPRVSRVGHG